MCKPSLVFMKFSPLKFFSRFLFLVLEEHSNLSHPHVGTCPFAAAQASLMEKLQPRASLLGLNTPQNSSSVSTGPAGINKSLHSSLGSSLLLAYGIYSRPSPCSLPSLASCPTGKTEATSLFSLWFCKHTSIHVYPDLSDAWVPPCQSQYS